MFIFWHNSASILHPACSEPPDPGFCRGRILSYYFDPYTDSCQQFFYGGCGGNLNRFNNLKACLFVCKRAGTPFVLRKLEEWRLWRKAIQLIMCFCCKTCMLSVKVDIWNKIKCSRMLVLLIKPLGEKARYQHISRIF